MKPIRKHPETRPLPPFIIAARCVGDVSLPTALLLLLLLMMMFRPPVGQR